MNIRKAEKIESFFCIASYKISYHLLYTLILIIFCHNVVPDSKTVILRARNVAKC